MRSSWGGPQPNLVGYPLRQSRCQSPNRSLQHASNKCPQSPRISHIWVSPGHRGPVRTSKNALKATTRPALPASIFLAISKTLHPTSPYVHLHLLSRTASSMSQSCPLSRPLLCRRFAPFHPSFHSCAANPKKQRIHFARPLSSQFRPLPLHQPLIPFPHMLRHPILVRLP